MSHGQQLDDLLAKMRFVSEAKGQNLDQESSGQKTDSPPPFSGMSLYDDYVRDVDQLLRNGEKKLHSAQHSPPPSMTPDGYRKYLLKKYAGKDPEFVAMAERLSVSFVRQMRKEAGVSERHGLEKGVRRPRSGQK